MVEDPVQLLAVYGSLAPGEPNHWVVSRIAGEWHLATAKGHLFEITWGPAAGFDGFLPDPEGSDVAVWVLSSSQLQNKWREIDDFEGEGYERQIVPIELSAGSTTQAHIYVALTDN